MLEPAHASFDYDADAIVGAIERDGYAVIDNYLRAEDVASARELIIQKVRSNGNETVVALHSFERFENPFLSALPSDPKLAQLCKSVCAKGFGAAPDVALFPSLRCLTGKSAREHSMYFHYDSYAVTVIIPIIVPSSGKRGRLIVYPNTRKIRKVYFANFLDKFMSDRKSTQKFYRAMYDRSSTDLRCIEMKPGSLYLFSGYRSMHTNEEVDADQIRATAVFHYFDPHAQSWTKKLFLLRFKLRRAMAALTSGARQSKPWRARGAL